MPAPTEAATAQAVNPEHAEASTRAGDAGAQPLRVLIAGRVEHLRGRTALDDASAVHDDRLVGDLTDDREVVADEHVGHAGPVADVGEQVEDLRLDRDIERRDGLVEDDHPRLGGERPRDRDALALAARERAREGHGTGGRRARPGLPSSRACAARAALEPPRCRRRTSSIACAALWRGSRLE